jgi:hypothetical protein
VADRFIAQSFDTFWNSQLIERHDLFLFGIQGQAPGVLSSNTAGTEARRYEESLPLRLGFGLADQRRLR